MNYRPEPKPLKIELPKIGTSSMVSLQISEADFNSWREATNKAISLLENLPSPESGDYGKMAEHIATQHGYWSREIQDIHPSLSSLRDMINKVEGNLRSADEQGAV